MDYTPPEPVQIDKHIQTGIVIRGYQATHLHEAFAVGAASRDVEIERLRSAARTLEQLGYTDAGGVLWMPPIGKAPDFNLIDALKAEVEALKAELREGDDLRERLAGILTRSVNVIRGEPEPMSLHSWHDLPELVEALKADAERLDWLTEQGQKTTFQWFARDSLVNRGYRLHQGHGVGSATPRAAIDAARSKT